MLNYQRVFIVLIIHDVLYPSDNAGSLSHEIPTNNPIKNPIKNPIENPINNPINKIP